MPMERLRGLLAGLKSEDRRALGVVTVFLSVVMAYVLLVEPVVFRYQGATEALAKLMAQERQFQQKVAMLPRREAKLEEYRQQMDGLNRFFTPYRAVPEKATPKVIAELIAYGRRSSVAIGGIRPLDAQEGERFTEAPLELEAVGSFASIHRFLYYVETAPTLLAVTDLEMTGEKEGSGLRARIKVSAMTQPPAQPLEEVAEVPPGRRLRLIVPEWPRAASLLLAKRLGYFQEAGIAVEWLRPEGDTAALLLSGEADGAALSLFDLIDKRAQGIDLRGVLPLSVDHGAYGLVVRGDSAIQDVRGLRREQVAASGDGHSTWLLSRALPGAEGGLAADSDASSPREVARDLANGLQEAGLVDEPWLGDLLVEGRFRMLFSSAALPDAYPDLLALRPETLRDKAEAVGLLVSGVLRAARLLAERPAEAAETLAATEQRSPQTVQAILAKFTYYGDHAARAWIDHDLEPAVNGIEAYYTSVRRPFPAVAPSTLIDPAVLGRMMQDNAGDAGR